MAITPRPTPPLNASMLDAGGQISIAWTEYFLRLANQQVTTTDLEGVVARVDTLESEFAVFSTGYLPIDGGTLGGSLTISMPNAEFWLNRPAAGTFAVLQSQTAGLPRWDIVMADDALETGGNAGSNFAIARFDDTGAFLGVPMTISRATGQVLINGVDLAAHIAVIEARLTAAGIP